MDYRCDTCAHTDAGDLEAFAETASELVHKVNRWPAPAWWIPGAPWPVIQGEIAAWLRTHGRCCRHAGVLAAIAVDAMRRRCYGETMPGHLRVMSGDLRTEPYDEIAGLDEAEDVAQRVRAILSSAQRVGALLTVDRERARMRCTFILVDAVGVVEVSLPAARLRRWPEGANIERALRR